MNVREQRQRVSQPNYVGVGPERGVARSQDALQESRPYQHLGLEDSVAVSTGADGVLPLLQILRKVRRRGNECIRKNACGKIRRTVRDGACKIGTAVTCNQGLASLL